MVDVSREGKVARFRSLHDGPGTFVIPNPWDAGSARILTALGFPALATTSAGLAFALGLKDNLSAMPRDVLLANARAIVDATHLPVSADLQDGFGQDPASVAQTIASAAEHGLVGGSIEDATGDPSCPIHDLSLSVERVAAAAQESRRCNFVLTARAENYLWGRPDLDDTIRRLQAFEAAGAEVLYAPGLTSLEDIRTLCASVSSPVNVVMGLKGAVYTVDELAACGVRRISVGGSLARAALGGLMRAAQEIAQHGTFTYAADALSAAQAEGFMRETMAWHRPGD